MTIKIPVRNERHMKIEVCIDNIETAKAVEKLGIDRVELCSALDLGGLTPSYGLIEALAEQTKLLVNVMIRTTPGDFVYSDEIIDIMLKDIEMAKVAGAHGVVFGCLTEFNEINHDQNELLISKAQDLGLDVTFHRAIDFVEDPYQAMEVLIDLGFDKILTSGQAKTAFEGRETIRKMVKFANHRTGIMAGSGVNAQNVKEIAGTGVDFIHFTSHKTVLNGNIKLGMGTKTEPDIDKLTSIIEALR